MILWSYLFILGSELMATGNNFIYPEHQSQHYCRCCLVSEFGLNQKLLSIKVMNRTGDKEPSWWSPTFIRNRLTARMISICLEENCIALTAGRLSSTLEGPFWEILWDTVGCLSQESCEPNGQIPGIPRGLWGERAAIAFHSLVRPLRSTKQVLLKTLLFQLEENKSTFK